MRQTERHYTLTEVCEYYGYSESTIRRKIKESREGVGTFPRPIFPAGHKVLFRKSDIENWVGESGAEVVTFTPSPTHHRTQQIQNEAVTMFERKKEGDNRRCYSPLI